jgi:hypothetical protein
VFAGDELRVRVWWVHSVKSKKCDATIVYSFLLQLFFDFATIVQHFWYNISSDVSIEVGLSAILEFLLRRLQQGLRRDLP